MPLVIIRGNSGSGKTSVSRALQKKLGRNTFLISQDTVRREMLYARDGADTAALPLMIELLRYGSVNCGYVILEGILNADWYKPLFEAAVNFFKNRITAYYYDLSFEETLKRHKTRKQADEFGEPEMRGWYKEKDFIGLIPEKVFDEAVSFEDAVDIVYADVTDI